HQDFFQVLDSIFTETRYMELQDGTDSTIGSGDSGFAPRSDIEIESRFAIAHDRTGGVAGGGIDRMVEPNAVPGGHHDLCIETAEGLGIGVFDLGSHGAESLPSIRIARTGWGKIGRGITADLFRDRQRLPSRSCP